MRLSVILATYNAPQWLEKVLWGYSAQTFKAFEIVVADDGSTSETAEVVTRMARETGLTIRHVWHEDRGFRKCKILNQAIRAATSDYLVFSDGDCIPCRHFLATHHKYAQPGRYLSGGLVRLPMELSQHITADDIRQGRSTQTAWLLRHGLKLRKRCLLLTGPRPLGTLLDAITPTKATWNGHNASGWKADLLRVNGFDERMGYGGEDCEMGERLVNLGIRPRQIRHRAVLVHLDHGRGYVNQDILLWNRQHRQNTRDHGTVWTEYGIVQSPAAERETMTLEFPGAGQSVRRKAA